MKNNTQKKYNTYTDFLQDEEFIRWQILKDDSLDKYWSDYISQHPDKQPLFDEAISRHDAIKMNNYKLGSEDKAELLSRIKISTNKNRQKVILRNIAAYAAVACLFIITLIIFRIAKTDAIPIETDDRFIVGQQLGNSEITLITSSGVKSYGSDVHLTMNANGVASIKSDSLSDSKVEMNDNTTNTLIVPYGRRSRIDLADGSKVWLNSGSRMEFPSRFTNKTRDITMTGEIYIEVAPDKSKPFYVHTTKMKVNVLGTKFNINSYEETTEQSVVLVEGSVQVQVQGNHSLTLKPNEMALYTNHILKQQTVDVTKYTSWINGYLTFDQTPISEVLKKIERYYNISFAMGNNINLQKRTCTGKIYLSENIDNVMKTISLLSGTTCRKEGQKIYISLDENAK